MRTLFSILGVCAALVMCAVSGAMNYLFLSSLGKSPLEGQVLGAASAAADVLKALLPFFVAWSWNARRFVASITGTIAFLFFAGFSLLSALGFAADNRGVLVDARTSVTATYRRLQHDLQEEEAKQGALPAHRPASVVAQDIEGHRQNRRWVTTDECQNATEAESRQYCERYFALRAELAAGQEAEKISDAIAVLQTQAAKLRDQGAGLDLDPQVSLLSRIVGQEQDKVRLALIVIVALLVELGSSLGLFLATGHRNSTEKTVAAPGAASSVSDPSIEGRPIGSVEDFCLEALVASEKSALGPEALFFAYQAWSEGRGLVALEGEAFLTKFSALATSVGIRRQDGRYSGIELASQYPDCPMAA